jgi:hypothetical protein
MPHVREREPNPDEPPEDDPLRATGPAVRDPSSSPDATSDADVDTDAAVLDPRPGE